MNDAPQSPCVGVCTLDAAGHLCLGCGRTAQEISLWSFADAERKREIIAAAAARLGPWPRSSGD